MPEIKTREVVQGTIKTLDRSAVVGERMKNAYVKTKDKAEHSVYAAESSPEEYAADCIRDTATGTAQEVAYYMDKQRQKFIRRKAQERRQGTIHQDTSTAEAAPPSANDSPSAPLPTVPDAAPQQEIRPSRQGRTNSPRRDIKTIERSSEKIRQRLIPGKPVKSADRTIKTADRTVKSAARANEAMKQTAQQSAKAAAVAAQKAQAAMKATAAAAKTIAAATAKAIKAIIASAQKLITAICSGGVVAILSIIMVVMCCVGMMFASDENDTEILPVSDEVRAYESIIQKYAKEHGIGDYVLLIEAVMMLESGGRGTDPMQCSEYPFNTLYPNTPGAITDPEYSINVGIQNLADCLQIAQSEGPMDIDAIKLALQGYNFGQGYITWAMNKYGGYSKANAVEFSLKTAEQLGWERYGNMDYVPLVLQYYPLGQILYDPDTSVLIVEVAKTQIGNVGGEPYWRWYGFTSRVEWCACFVSWCAEQCGYIEAGVIPKFAGCDWGVYFFRSRDLWADGAATPVPGMIIFFDWNNKGRSGPQDGTSDHVGIVERVEDGIVYTIEGNSGDACRQRSYPIGHFEILGYGMPEY